MGAGPIFMFSLFGFLKRSKSVELIALVAITAMVWGVIYLNYDMSR